MKFNYDKWIRNKDNFELTTKNGNNIEILKIGDKYEKDGKFISGILASIYYPKSDSNKLVFYDYNGRDIENPDESTDMYMNEYMTLWFNVRLDYSGRYLESSEGYLTESEALVHRLCTDLDTIPMRYTMSKARYSLDKKDFNNPSLSELMECDRSTCSGLTVSENRSNILKDMVGDIFNKVDINFSVKNESGDDITDIYKKGQKLEPYMSDIDRKLLGIVTKVHRRYTSDNTGYKIGEMNKVPAIENLEQILTGTISELEEIGVYNRFKIMYPNLVPLLGSDNKDELKYKYLIEKYGK